MKIAINACHGGFDLHEDAIEAILIRKGVPYEWDQNAELFYRQDLTFDVDNKHYVDNFSFARNDPDLIAVIEELGHSAWGFFSELKVVEIPDDVDWIIEDYDGYEWIAEKHRTWR